MASNYQNSKFVGLDMFKAFPAEIKPFNVEFQLADVTKEIPFPENSFDFVRMSTMWVALGMNYNNVLLELVR